MGLKNPEGHTGSSQTLDTYETSHGRCCSAEAATGRHLWVRRLVGSWFRARPVIFVLPVLVPMGSAAAQDCSIGRDDWDDIQRFRRCIEEHGLDAWTRVVLHQAAGNTTNPTIVRLLLQAGADPNAPDDDGRTPLHRGAENSNPMVVTHLLDAGADLGARDNEGYTALHWAAAHSGNGRVIKVLLDRGADPFAESNDGRTPLHSALRYRAEPSVVSRMLDAGADEHLTRLQLSALQGDVMAVDKLLAEGADPNEGDRYGWGPLHFAVPLAGLEVVSALLAAGADPEARTVSGATALHLGASQATAPVVAALLSAGADPNARESKAGESALHYAAQLREEDLLPVVTSLLEAGADPGSSNNYGNTPLHRALVNPAVTVPVVRALLDAGADPMARNQWEITPLHVAADVLDDIGIIETLLAAGADVRAVNENGNRPVDVAWHIRGSAAYWRLVVPEGTLTHGRTFNGSLSSSDAVWEGGSHYDVWTVTARAGQRVVIDMESDEVDAYLRVLRNDGTPIANDDDGGSGSNARVEFRAPYGGDYLVIATSFEAGEVGGYGVARR